MKKKYISLRAAVIIPLFFIMLGVLATFVILNKADYEWIAKEQGSKIIEVLYKNTEYELKHLLTEPEIANKYYKDIIYRTNDYNNKDLSQIQDVSLSALNVILEDLPQVTAIGFGNENGDYVGYRVNGDGTKNLMLKDARTKNLLNIYSTEDIKSDVIDSFEDYDSRLRPWYIPVKKSLQSQWSEVYVNQDEKREMTITTLTPLNNNKGDFQGVVAMDVKLDFINEFLKANEIKENALIYIVDASWNIIASSSDDAEVYSDEASYDELGFLEAYKSKDILMMNSARTILKDSVDTEELFQMNIDGKRYFSLHFPLNEPKELDWKIVVVVPEKDIMGAVKEKQDTTLTLVVMVLIAATAFGVFILTLLINPIQSSSDAVRRVSEGEWDFELGNRKMKTQEVEELISSFEMMRTRLKDSFNKLEISESKYRLLIENTDDMIYSITPKGYIISANNSFEKEFGLEDNKYIGSNFSKLFSIKQNGINWEKEFEDVVRTKKTKNINFEYINKDNQKIVLNAKLNPQLDDDGEVKFILGTNTNITELVEAQEKIEELLMTRNKELEKLVELRTIELEETMAELIDREKLASLGSLVSGIAHEINTPLGVAVTAGSYLDMINTRMIENNKSGKITKKSFNEYLENVDESSNIININISRASELIRSFKEISVNQRVEDITEFNFYEYMQSILTALKHEYKNTSHAIDIICPQDIIINSYQGAFSQILTNLIMNSLQHAFEGIENGLIRIEAKKHEDSLEIIFSDNGNGISEENLAHIFDPFFTTNRKKGGSGLGLNITYNLVTGKLGGKISCESEIGDGTKFIIKIPMEF